MGILEELDRLIEVDLEDEENEDEINIDREENDDEEEDSASNADVDDLLSHIKNLQDAAVYVDAMIERQADDDPAFRAEIAIRKAIGDMQELSDKLYKKKAK
jgi:hypothetical protein